MFFYTSIAIVGNFNPAIFQPQWFDRFKILPAQDIQYVESRKPETHEFKLGGGSVFFTKNPILSVSPSNAILNFEGFKIESSRDRFICSTTTSDNISKIEDVICKTFMMLSHTPIISVGFNFEGHYLFDKKSEILLNDLFGNQPKKFDSCFGSDYLVSGTIIYRDGETVTTVEIKPSNHTEGGIFFHTNINFNLSDKSTDSCCSIIKDKFRGSREMSIKYLLDLFGKPAKISYENEGINE
ncbi:MAG: hypothetical protein KKA60_14735 [Proteobacteria bacterium]|nr:hypothetical protein [Pseudomonadota bacterium]